MNLVLKNANVFVGGRFRVVDVLVADGVFVSSLDSSQSVRVLDFRGKYIFPGFTDVHVHLREPGFSYKETIESGTAAAARGGFTTVCAMPNLIPPPDGRAGLDAELAAIKGGARIRVLPYGTITKGSAGDELSAFEEMSDAVAFTDDGRGTTPEVLRDAMVRIGAMGKIVASHCEDATLKGGDHIAAGSPYSAMFGIPGISRESEYVQLRSELAEAAQTGCPYHMCHLSCRESVALIREAKAAGLDVTCETAPHYIALDYNDITADDGRFKMNPPLRSAVDRKAIIEGIADGTIDMIATDHAPHSAGEKGKGLLGSAMGVVGLESAFAVCYTALVKSGFISLERLVELMSTAPNKRFKTGSHITPGMPADLAVFDLEERFTLNPAEFYSKGRSTPFEGAELFGECLLTVCGGRVVYEKQ